MTSIIEYLNINIGQYSNGEGSVATNDESLEDNPNKDSAVSVAAGVSTFVLAYAVHKVFAPVRIGVTLSCTPFIVKHLRKTGFLKSSKKV